MIQNMETPGPLPEPYLHDHRLNPKATPPPLLVTKLEGHKVNPTNDLVDIIVTDPPGAGGAHHRYMVYWPDAAGYIQAQAIHFQNGPIKESGVNGMTQEVLLTIVQHRLQCFQAGPYACEENQKALEHVTLALHTLKGRTLARMKRGVEGTHAK